MSGWTRAHRTPGAELDAVDMRAAAQDGVGGTGGEMTRVYRYGVLGEPSPLGPIRRELALRAKYWDALVAVEAQYRRRERTLLGGAHQEAVDAAKAAYEAATGAEKDAALAALKEAKAHAKAERARLRIERKAELDLAWEERRAALIAARVASGLWRGNYIDVREDFDAAAKRAAAIGVELSAGKGARCLTAAKVPRPYRTEDALAAVCTWFQLDMTTANDRPGRKPHPIARVRMGSDESMRPLWAQARITLHRPLPEGAELLRASYVRVGRRKWALCVTIKEADAVPVPGGRTVTVEVRVEGDRIAVWSANDGLAGEVRLPGLEAKLAHADAIERVLWEHYRQAVDMCDLAEEPVSPHALARWARTSALPEAKPYLERYWHLWSWVCGERRKCQRRRQDAYRKAAAAICAGSARVEFVATPGPKWAAIGELKLALQSVCARHGAEFASDSDLRRRNQRRPSRRSQTAGKTVGDTASCSRVVAVAGQSL